MEYKKTSAFSTDKINEVYKFVKKKNLNLYFFAYYTPISYDESIGARENFIRCVNNLYILYTECYPLKKQKIQYELFGKELFGLIYHFQDLLSWLRGLYCHNSSKEDCENNWNEKYNKHIKNYFLISNKFKLICSKFFDNFPEFITPGDKFFSRSEDWIAGLECLCSISDYIILEMKNSVNKELPDKTIQDLIKCIINWICKSYLHRFDFFLANIIFSMKKDKTKKETKLSAMVNEKWLCDESTSAMIKCAEDKFILNNGYSEFSLLPIEMLTYVYEKCQFYDEEHKPSKVKYENTP